MNKRVWITWEHQTRNISMAQHLDCDYCELSSKRHRILRYIFLSFSTLVFLFKRKPEEIFFQNPSIVLASICALYKKISSRVIVIGDFHNAALEKSKLAPINCFISRNIDLTIVSNPKLISRVEEMKGHAFVMPDPIPQPPHQIIDQSDEKFIVFICSWANDEPITTVLDAFINSNIFALHNICLYVTGRTKPGRLEKDVGYYDLKEFVFSDLWRNLPTGN
jgi:hypothetical protein